MLTTDIPTAESLKLTSRAPAPATGLPSLVTETPLKRDDWMLEGTSKDDLESSADFFSMLGGETRKKKQPPPPPDPDNVCRAALNYIHLLKPSCCIDKDKLKGIEHATEGWKVPRRVCRAGPSQNRPWWPRLSVADDALTKSLRDCGGRG